MASCVTIPNMGNSLLGGQRLFWCQTGKTISADRKSSEAMSLAGMYANFGNCEKKPKKFRPSTGFETLTSRYRCGALTNLATKPLTLAARHLWFLMFP